MTSVVMIAHFFPPEGSAGAFRPLRFIRHLSKMGWCTSVVTAKPYRYERYDPDLARLVPRETEVVRVRGHDLWQAIQLRRGQRTQNTFSGASLETVAKIHAGWHRPVRSRIRKAVRTAESWWYQPDKARSWIQPATEATVRLCERKQSNVIWATVGPMSAALVAQQASQCTGVPYVLDFRDPWGLGYYDRVSGWSRRIYRRTIYQALKHAQAVVFLFPTVAECYWHFYQGALQAEKLHIIPNGYEGPMEEFAASDANRCTILYAGTLSTYRYDTLLQSLCSLKRSDPRARRLRFLFVGEHSKSLELESAKLGLSDIIETLSPASHADIARMQRNAHALLVLGRDPERRGYELVAGAKLFGYLKARRPIIGILPQDETRKILEDLGVSTVADVESPSEITAVLQKVLCSWSEGTLSSLLPDRAASETYSAERQTTALVRALLGEPSVEPFVPGSVEIPPSLRGDIYNRELVSNVG